MFVSLCLFLSGSPKSRTWHNLDISQAWATSPQLPCLSMFHLKPPSVRTGSPVVWEALESSPPGLQPGALPFELPNLVCFCGVSYEANDSVELTAGLLVI